jgi:ferritin
MEATTLTILRGPHTVDAVTDLVRLLTHQDVVLFEAVMHPKYKPALRKAYMQLSRDPAHAEWLEQDALKGFKDFMWTQVVWELRGQRKIFDFVDVELEAEGEEAYAQVTGVETIAEAVQKSIQNPDQRYQLITEAVDYQAQKTRTRDELVVKQIVTMLEANKEYVGRVAQKKGTCRVAVVQGFMHNIRTELQRQMPTVGIEELIYDRKHLNQLLRDPFGYLLYSRLQDPDKPLDPKAIDYYVCAISEIGINSQPEELKAPKAGEVAAAGMSHPRIMGMQAVVDKLGPQANYSAQELKTRADQLLSAIKQEDSVKA